MINSSKRALFNFNFHKRKKNYLHQETRSELFNSFYQYKQSQSMYSYNESRDELYFKLSDYRTSVLLFYQLKFSWHPMLTGNLNNCFTGAAAH